MSGEIDIAALRAERDELLKDHRVKPIFPDTPRGNAVSSLYHALAELMDPEGAIVLLAITLRAWNSPDLSCVATNQDLTWDTGLLWHDVLTIARWLGRKGLITIGKRVDYYLREDVYIANYLVGLPPLDSDSP